MAIDEDYSPEPDDIDIDDDDEITRRAAARKRAKGKGKANGASGRVSHFPSPLNALHHGSCYLKKPENESYLIKDIYRMHCRRGKGLILDHGTSCRKTTREGCNQPWRSSWQGAGGRGQLR